jgi:hypothetical protein
MWTSAGGRCRRCRTTPIAGIAGAAALQRGVDRVGPGLLRHAGSGALDLGEYMCNDLASVRPSPARWKSLAHDRRLLRTINA